MNWIDVTRPLQQELAGWPGDTPVLLEQHGVVHVVMRSRLANFSRVCTRVPTAMRRFIF